jgi:hypothetical protein
MMTTHTPTLARTLPDKCLQYIHQNVDKTRKILRGGKDTNQLIAKSLGVLPDNSIKLFVGVEGPHDIAFLKHVSRVLRSAGVDVADLEKMELDGELIFFPLGGSSLALWTSRLEPLSRPEFHLYDRDTQPPADARYQVTVDGINRRERCKALSTGKKEMENYLHFQAINETYDRFNISLGLASGFGDFDDVPSLVAEKVHALSGSPKRWSELNDATRKSKRSQAKANLNGIATSLMTKERLAQVDPSGDVIGWFNHMKQLADG